MTATVDNGIADPQHTIVELRRQLDEALQREAATAEVLQLINRSPGDLAPVFDAILEKAHRLCGAAFGSLLLYDGEYLRAAATRGLPEGLADLLRQPFSPEPNGPGARLIAGDRFYQIADQAELLRRPSPPNPRASASFELAGVRTVLFVPLRRDDALLGIITVYRREARPFTDKQIALLENFAAQAVIAMENARLLTEAREALEQQTATAEVLGVINSSPGDLAPVFDAMLDKATSLCDAAFGFLDTYDGEFFHRIALRGATPEVAEFMTRTPHPVGPDNAHGRLLRGEPAVHIADITTDKAFLSGDPLRRALVELGGRTLLAVPLRKEGLFLGNFIIFRKEVRPFTDKQIALLQNFAAQAVIAMENARLITETKEALDQQTATAEVLGVINSSPGDLAPVFDAILEKAHSLCAATKGALVAHDGTHFRAVATRGLSERYAKMLRESQDNPPGSPPDRLLQGESIIHIPDFAALDLPIPRAGVELEGARTVLFVPLRKDTALFGYITAYRQEVRPFTDKQIALLENFAAQAVIAMENARLITETREALDQQTATAEVLQIINSSPGDLAPVFDAMLEKAMRLCEASIGAFYSFDGEFLDKVAHRGNISAEHIMQTQHVRAEPGGNFFRLIHGETIVHVADLKETEMYRSGFRRAVDMVDIAGARTAVWVGLRRDETLLGILVIYRQEVRPFTDKQIALLQNFGAQAVIAMENARLITETREALDQQTATAEVLQVINSSPGDLAPVFDAMLEKAVRLLNADFGILWRFEDGLMRLGASYNVADAFTEYHLEPMRPGPESGPGRMIRGGSGFITGNFLEFPPYLAGDPAVRSIVELAGARSAVIAPLRKDGTALGSITIYRKEVQPFSEKQLAVLENFAAQAVIAMENARLITETREALEQQTATAKVLQVINSSPGDLTPVFDVILEKAHTLCGVDHGSLQLYDGELYRAVAIHGAVLSVAEQLRRPRRPDPNHPIHRLFAGEPFAHVPDLAEIDTPGARNMVKLAGLRTVLYVALRKEESLLGFIGVGRKEVRPFTDKEIALLQNFAAQAVIAIENARLLTATREARDTAETALRQLKGAQANLIQAEKMASLGQLTAGIAHEIKNPLNFVNNFASLSVELLDELKAAAAPAIAGLGDDTRAEIDETVAMLTSNLEKIAEHGRRADGIVRSMLEHSRGGTGERRSVDLNGLVEEALNLAYHGARAQDQSFNITLERDLGAAITPIELVPQDVTRVFLNLFGNGFYAATKRRRGDAEPGFEPVLKVTTRDLGDAVEIRVRDNGVGIAPEIKDKLFQPFFTTKPTGEGTGLGLSISYDIVTQEHGGTITVDSRVGEFTEFTIRLPRDWQAAMTVGTA
jgi:GAF domain-containing protein